MTNVYTIRVVVDIEVATHKAQATAVAALRSIVAEAFKGYKEHVPGETVEHVNAVAVNAVTVIATGTEADRTTTAKQIAWSNFDVAAVTSGIKAKLNQKP